jgi:error-prone DNA polymerase
VVGKVSLEDDTGLVNVVVSTGLWAVCRPVVKASRALLVRGVVESASGAVNLLADRITALDVHGQGAGRGQG